MHLGGALHDALHLASLVVLQGKKDHEGSHGVQHALPTKIRQVACRNLLAGALNVRRSKSHAVTVPALTPYPALTLTKATVYLSVGLKGMNLAMAYSSHSVSLQQKQYPQSAVM